MLDGFGSFGGIVQNLLWGVMLIASGVVYLRKPNVFRRGIWMKTSIAIRFLSEDNYRRYMKGLGAVFIVIGAALVLFAVVAQLDLHD